MKSSSFPSSTDTSEAMSPKVAIILVVLALAGTGIIEASYIPDTDTAAPQTQGKHIETPFIYTRPEKPSAPSTEGRKLTKRHGVEQTIYTKSVNAYSDGNGYSQHIPIYSTGYHDNPYVYQSAYNLPTPIVHAVSTPTLTKSISVPIYTTHSIPVTKTKTTLLKNIKVIGPVYGKAKIATTTYATHDPVIVSQPVKTAIAYSDAPVVSHMTFSGLGASYGW